MSCVSPPELTDTELMSYVDGEAEADVAAHLARCPHCRERAHRLARFQGRLTAQLYRLTCPSPAELGEYHLGLLPESQAAAIDQHLAECPHCAREVAQLRDYLTGLAPDLELNPLERVREQIRTLVAQLVRSSSGLGGTGMLSPAYAGVRGAAESLAAAPQEQVSVYEADDIQITVEVQNDTEQPDRKVLLGLVLGMGARGAEAHLWQADRPVSRTPVDDLGNFCFASIASGSYELILTGPGVEVHIQDLEA